MVGPKAKSAAKGSKADLMALRRQQLQEVTDAVEDLGRHLDQLRQQTSTLEYLKSVAVGLYEELDKLTKKAPAEQVTDLILRHVNDVIRQLKAFSHRDTYVHSLTEFVPAGDNPEQRDVLIVLRQVLQALGRHHATLNAQKAYANDLLVQAQTVQVAVGLFLQDHTTVSRGDIEENIPSASAKWLRSYHFRFDLLDMTNIRKHFTPETEAPTDTETAEAERADE